MIKELFLTKDNKIDMRAFAALSCLILATLGIDPVSLRTWPDVGGVFFEVVGNPYKLILIAGAVYGWARNNRTEATE